MRALRRGIKSETDLTQLAASDKDPIIGGERRGSLSLRTTTKMKLLALRARRRSDDAFEVYKGAWGGSPRTSTRGSRRRAKSLVEQGPSSIKFNNAQRQRHLARRARRKRKVAHDRKTSQMIRNTALRQIETRQTRPVSWARSDSKMGSFEDMVKKATSDIMMPSPSRFCRTLFRSSALHLHSYGPGPYSC